jgi:hypothetical protein
VACFWAGFSAVNSPRFTTHFTTFLPSKTTLKHAFFPGPPQKAQQNTKKGPAASHPAF